MKKNDELESLKEEAKILSKEHPSKDTRGFARSVSRIFEKLDLMTNNSLIDDVRQLLTFVNWILESNIPLCDKRCLMKDVDTEVGNVRTNSCDRETCPEFVLRLLADNVRIECDAIIHTKQGAINGEVFMTTEEELKLKLKPCAHCGNIPDVYYRNCAGDTYVGEEFMIECECGIGSVTYDKADKIVNDWNRRNVI